MAAQDGRPAALDLAEPDGRDDRALGHAAVQAFLQEHSVYDVLLQSGKVVVVDVNIPLHLAFFALVEHDIEGVPVWDAAQTRVAGLMGVLDFVRVLVHCAGAASASADEHPEAGGSSSSPMAAMSALTIADWMALDAEARGTPLGGPPALGPDDSLAAACRRFIATQPAKAHRLAVVAPDGRNALGVLGLVHVLQFLVTEFRDDRRLFGQSVRELGVGTWGAERLHTVRGDAPLLDCLRLMLEHHVAALPVLDEAGAVVDLYGASHATFLAQEGALGLLQTPLAEVQRRQRADSSGGSTLALCSPDDTMQTVFELFAAYRVAQLVAVDAERKPVGIVSLSDVFGYFTSPLEG